jgi:hypothetical protein
MWDWLSSTYNNLFGDIDGSIYAGAALILLYHIARFQELNLFDSTYGDRLLLIPKLRASDLSVCPVSS